MFNAKFNTVIKHHQCNHSTEINEVKDVAKGLHTTILNYKIISQILLATASQE